MKYLKKYNEDIEPFNDDWLDIEEEEEWDYFGEEVVRIYDEDLSYLNLWSGIKKLHFLNNKIKELPELPEGLEKLYCSNTKITKLPELPEGLKELSCWNTKITELPELPEGLEKLYCFNTNIKEIPKKFYNKQDANWLRKNNVKMI